VVEDEQAAVAHALATSQAGDLVVVFGDDVQRCWGQITAFHADGPQAPSDPAAFDGAPPFTLPSGRRLVRDARGVRLA
jgi:cyanophycin synthetase